MTVTGQTRSIKHLASQNPKSGLLGRKRLAGYAQGDAYVTNGDNEGLILSHTSTTVDGPGLPSISVGGAIVGGERMTITRTNGTESSELAIETSV